MKSNPSFFSIPLSQCYSSYSRHLSLDWSEGVSIGGSGRVEVCASFRKEVVPVLRESIRAASWRQRELLWTIEVRGLSANDRKKSGNGNLSSRGEVEPKRRALSNPAVPSPPLPSSLLHGLLSSLTRFLLFQLVSLIILAERQQRETVFSKHNIHQFPFPLSLSSLYPR